MQRLRYNILRRLSIDNDLNGFIREKLGEFNQESVAKRKAMLRAQASIAKSKHKIEVSKPSGGGKRKAVAIYDPETKRVIKQYSSLNSASTAAMYILNKLGYQSEIELSLSGVKNIVQKSRRDPSILLFGYRWLTMDSLRKGDFVVNDECISAASQSKPTIEIVKKCVLSETILSTFPSSKEAFKDWLNTISSASEIELAENNRSIDNFENNLMQGGVSFRSTTWSTCSNLNFKRDKNVPSISSVLPASKENSISKATDTEESSKVDEKNKIYVLEKDIQRKNKLESAILTNETLTFNDTSKSKKDVSEESTHGKYILPEKGSPPTSIITGMMTNDSLQFAASPLKVSGSKGHVVSTESETPTKGTEGVRS